MIAVGLHVAAAVFWLVAMGFAILSGMLLEEGKEGNNAFMAVIYMACSATIAFILQVVA